MAPLICRFTMLMLFTLMSLQIFQQKRHYSGPFNSILFNSIEAQRGKDVLEKHQWPCDRSHTLKHTHCCREKEREEAVSFWEPERGHSVSECVLVHAVGFSFSATALKHQQVCEQIGGKVTLLFHFPGSSLEPVVCVSACSSWAGNASS